MRFSKEAYAELDRLGRQKPPHTQEDEAAYRKWRDQVWLLAFGDADLRAAGAQAVCDALNDVLIKELPKFDPQRGDLGKFLGARIADRQKTKQKKTQTEQNRTVSIEPPRDPEEGGTPGPGATLADGRETPEQAAEGVEAYQRAPLVMAAQIQNFLASKGRANNPRRRLYYRMWYTEKLKRVAESMGTGRALEALQSNEQVLLNAVHIPYLDFFTAEDCRTIQRLAAAALCLRASGEALAWNSDGWLPARVPAEYLRTVEGIPASGSTISEQRSAYRRDLEQRLGQEGLGRDGR